jgi:integrase
MKLTDASIKNLKPKDKMYRKSDGKGLEIEIRKTGGKFWRYRYRFDNKYRMLAIGEYPHIKLAAARKIAFEYRDILAQGINPQDTINEKKAEQSKENCFEAIAKLWHVKASNKWSDSHAERVWRRIESNILPTIGNTPVKEIRPTQIIKLIGVINQKGFSEVAERTLSDISRIFRYAVQHEIVDINPARELQGIVDKKPVTHREALPREHVPAFLRQLDNYHTEQGGYIITEIALKILMLTFVRSKELRYAEWKEFDLQEKLWRIPGERMKMKVEHLVPITPHLEKLLIELQGYAFTDRLLFPSIKDAEKPISDNTLRLAMFRMGYDGKHADKPKAVPYGLRATACSILNEQGFNADAIERQLAHQERNEVRGAYTHLAKYLKERRELMLWWAKYLAKAKVESKVIPLFKKA